MKRPSPIRSIPAILAAAALVTVVWLVQVGAAGAAQQPQRSSYLGPEEGETLTSWTERWLDGPVRYIATEEEIAQYEALDSTSQRLAFIRLFWERRDPTARDADNAYLEEFVRRVEYADEEFTDGPLAAGGLPGWQTAFGRVALILGPPDRTRRELGFPTSVSQRPVILWGYDRRLPSPWPSNEMLMFVFQRGRWRLAPPSTLTDPASAETAARELERSTPFAEIPNDFLRVTRELVAETLVQPVNYNMAVEAVEADVAFPDAEIPFGWEASYTAGEGGNVDVTLQLSWRMESLVFHVVEGNYETEMVVTATLTDDGNEPVADTSERIEVSVPVADLAARNDEIVQRSLSMSVPPGTYHLRLALDDFLLGYRSVYTEDLVVPSR
jgi:GWxTD domain-containing protein